MWDFEARTNLFRDISGASAMYMKFSIFYDGWLRRLAVCFPKLWANMSVIFLSLLRLLDP
jgi:hypothetical protein